MGGESNYCDVESMGRDETASLNTSLQFVATPRWGVQHYAVGNFVGMTKDLSEKNESMEFTLDLWLTKAQPVARNRRFFYTRVLNFKGSVGADCTRVLKDW